jgi:hypothetical protein
VRLGGLTCTAGWSMSSEGVVAISSCYDRGLGSPVPGLRVRPARERVWPCG